MNINVYGLLPTQKVVEINQSMALKAGHLIAQSPMAKADFVGGSETYIQNGYILYLDIDGYLKSPSNVDAAIKAAQKPILLYNEEIFTTGLSEELKHFAEVWNADDEAYPRGIVLHVGDVFTTNNYAVGASSALATATLATMATDGSFLIHDNKADLITDLTTYAGPLWNVVPSTLPDGETDAVELMLLADQVSLS
jgi:hypothetical protein